jgi:hypothetical protein
MRDRRRRVLAVAAAVGVQAGPRGPNRGHPPADLGHHGRPIPNARLRRRSRPRQPHLQHGTVRVYPEASHAINGEYPDEIAADIDAFLAAVD